MKLLSVLMLLLWNISSTYGQGYFPKLEDLAVLKPITSSSTCGATSSKYCQSLTRQTSLTTCVEKSCEFDCCTNCSSAKPVSTDLALTSNKAGVTQDGDPRNGTVIRSFRFQGDSYIQPLRVPFINFQNPGFTISVWIKQKGGNKGTIISKDETTPPDFANVFQLVIKDYNLMFYHRPATGNASVATYNLLQSQSKKLQADEWHLITVAVISKTLSYYIDGELMNANFVTLSDYILDSGGGIRIGQKFGGDAEWQYEGLMQDIFMYERALTNREAEEAFTGVLPTVYVASHCRCPPTHPKINVAEPAKCLKNLDGDTDTLSRLSDTAHPIEFATDGDTLSFWVSEITENATIHINLAYTGLQIFYIVLTFYGPVPEAIKIERSVDSGHTYEPWQHFAEDCVTSFDLQNDGPLTQPDSVNCVQYVKPLQPSREVLTFQTEYPPPPGSNIPVRPFGSGCSNLYCSDSLLQFLKATHIKFEFYNHTLVQNPLHRYYGLERILVTGRCECFGHASSFSYIEGNSTHIGQCVCDCHPSTNTEGETCNRCKSLYNNKPFRRGEQDDSYPCVRCECNNHTNSCVYNQTLDTSPNSRTQGGGGVCINCQHNTTGRFCDVCKERFYRESGKSLKSPDVCSPCGCEGPGVQPGEFDCVKDDSNSSEVAGQCVCKESTQGRRCDDCKVGFYDFKASHITGCISCDCVLDGTINRDVSCHETSGQCYCKDRVTGRTCDTCKIGYWGLSRHEPFGCTTCDCDPFGTTTGNVNNCNSVTGQCSCKGGVIGRKCDRCKEGFHSLTPNGCDTLVAPNGTITLTVRVRNATAVDANWTRVALPNGKLLYNLMLYGKFAICGSADLRTEDRIETAISVEEAEKLFTYNGLLPFSDYRLWVNASNSVGFILSNNITVSTPEGVPSSLDQPRFRTMTSTSLTLVWEKPAEPNGVLLYCVIYQDGTEIKRVMGNVTQYVASGLKPFTVYVFKLSVCTVVGCRNSSDSVSQRTLSSGVDECTSFTHNCHLQATCSITDNTFTCTCKEGYVGDGRQCSGSQCHQRGQISPERKILLVTRTWSLRKNVK